MTIKKRIEDLAGQADDLLNNIKDLRYDLNRLNDDMEVVNEDFLDYIPDDLSAGEYDSLKEVLNKWRTENGYPAK